MKKRKEKEEKQKEKEKENGRKLNGRLIKRKETRCIGWHISTILGLGPVQDQNFINIVSGSSSKNGQMHIDEGEIINS
uniref:Uncharacterized protein n=1 Tax=Romanomermis culicivorax TaxID=13658 RepID=A0A915KR97_ROMCU